MSWFSRTRLVPLEFRGRQTPASTCAASLFPPLDSSGPPAAPAGEPTPGLNPSGPMGAQQAGEATEEPHRRRPRGPGVPAAG